MIILATDTAKLETQRIGYVRDGKVGRYVIPGESSVIDVELGPDGAPVPTDEVLLRSQLHRKLKAALQASDIDLVAVSTP